MFGHVIHCKTSAEVWTVLDQLFFSKSRARVLQLRFLLQTTKMGSGKIISNAEIVLYILGRLGPEFESVVVNLTSRDSMALQEVQYMLQTHEMRLENLSSASATSVVDVINPATHLTQKQQSFSFNSCNSSFGFRGCFGRGIRGRCFFW